MSIRGFLVLSFVQGVIFIFLKVWFFNNEIFANPGTQQTVFWLITGVVTAALVRRLAYLNFLEAFFIMFAWTVGDIILDFFITNYFTGPSIFHTSEYWISLLVLNGSLFAFHKKRHIAVRHELHARQQAKH